MSEHPHPKEIEELLAGYVLGDLTPEETEQVQHLLQTQPELVRDVQQLQQVLAALPYGLTASTPSDDLRSTILAAIQTPPTVTRRRIHPWAIASSVAAIAAIVLIIQNHQLQRQLDSAIAAAKEGNELVKLMQQPTSQLVALRGRQGAGNAIVTPGKPQIMVVLQHLPSLSTGQSYQAWGLRNGEKIPLGQFQAAADGNACVKFPIAPDQTLQGFAISIETNPHPSQPSSEIVLTSGV
jgi:anti-sigma-K factor RskA